MSRLAKYPIEIPQGVEVLLSDEEITVRGKLGSLSQRANPAVRVVKTESGLEVKLVDAESPTGEMRAHPGTMHALLKNMVAGVSKGFEKRLMLVGVGYRAQMQGNKLVLSLGYSHPVEFPVPVGISFELPSQTEIVVKGINLQQVGQVAAVIRGFRAPEPYKGKGIRYKDEVVRIKETKKKK
jgi:large subunit ribosomal protein L6